MNEPELSEHVFTPLSDGRFACTVCCRTWSYRPKFKCPGVPQYEWHQAPDYLLPVRQLKEAGLQPATGQLPAGCLWYGKTSSYIWLYDRREAVARPPASPARLAALEKARAALTCRGCGCRESRRRYLVGGYCTSCFEVKWARECLAQVDLRVLDTETTGLDSGDQVIEIAILDGQGNTLLDTLVRPDSPIPLEVSAIHGIHEEDVRNAQAWPAVYPQVVALLRGMYVVTYNADFDRRMIRQTRQRYGIEERLGAAGWACLMEAYKSFTDSRRWCSLAAACDALRVPRGGHRALGDARAALGLLRAMAGQTLPKEDTANHESGSG